MEAARDKLAGGGGRASPSENSRDAGAGRRVEEERGGGATAGNLSSTEKKSGNQDAAFQSGLSIFLLEVNFKDCNMTLSDQLLSKLKCACPGYESGLATCVPEVGMCGGPTPEQRLYEGEWRRYSRGTSERKRHA